MRLSFHHIFAPLALLLALGAGCQPGGWSNLSEATSSKETASSTQMTIVKPQEKPQEPAAPARWDRGHTQGGVVFTPPKGYWVTAIDELRTSYLIAGHVPEPDSPDPRVSVIPGAVASLTDLQNDPKSFPSWERFEITMAQFGCASGTSDEDFVACGDAAKTVSTGKTAGGFTYRVFTLPLKHQKTGASRGSRTFIGVRLREDGDAGVLVSVLDTRRGTAPSLELVKSMK
jgi:hypothetical protein